MSKEFLAVLGSTFLPTSQTITAVFGIPQTPSTKVKADGKGVLTIGTKVPIISATENGFVFSDPTGATTVEFMSSNASKSLDEGDVILVKGDTSAVTAVTGTNPQGATTTINVDAEITDAGQAKVKGE